MDVHGATFMAARLWVHIAHQATLRTAAVTTSTDAYKPFTIPLLRQATCLP